MQSTDIIQPTAIGTAIALNGDKTIPNQTASGTDTSSINAGFLPITSEPLDDGGVAPERTDFNGMFYLSTDQRVFLQNGGLITYSETVATKIGGYPQGAILGYLDANGNLCYVKSLIDNNQYNFISTPANIDGIKWEYITLKADLSNLPTNLTSIPPNSLTNFDGQWFNSFHTLSTSKTKGTYTIDISNYLPNDNYIYDVQLVAYAYHSGEGNKLQTVTSSIITESTAFNMVGSYADRSRSSIILPVGTDRKITYDISAGLSGGALYMISYHRKGTNQ